MSLSINTPLPSLPFTDSDQIDDLPSYSSTALSLPSCSSENSSSHIYERLFAPKRSFSELLKQLYSRQARQRAKASREQIGELTEEERKVAQQMIDQYWGKCISMGY